MNKHCICNLFKRNKNIFPPTDLMHDELYEVFKIVLDVLHKRWLTVFLKQILTYGLHIVIIAFARLLFKGILG